MDKVQFREDPAVLEFVKSRGLNPNEVARQAFQEKVRRMKGEDWLSRLRELQKGMKPFSVDGVVRDIRELRDA